jgi:glutamyl-tRNA reductase
MNPEVLLFHRRGPEPLSLRSFAELHKQGALTPPFSFKTCMRHIVLANSASGDAAVKAAVKAAKDGSADVFGDDDAYRFLLQVICGLHSPLIGETEVYGQFKNSVASYLEQDQSGRSARLNRWFQSLFEDAKKIRRQYLHDLGSQSYGSLLRRELRNTARVDIVGAGHLVQEILPWIAKDHCAIHIHCRNTAKAKQALGSLSARVQLHDLAALDTSLGNGHDGTRALVIAAPVTAEWVHQFASALHEVTVFDFRDTFATDQLSMFTRVIDLGTMLARISNNDNLLQERKQAALAAIDRLVEKRGEAIENRPFGWDDVSA